MVSLSASWVQPQGESEMGGTWHTGYSSAVSTMVKTALIGAGMD